MSGNPELVTDQHAARLGLSIS